MPNTTLYASIGGRVVSARSDEREVKEKMERVRSRLAARLVKADSPKLLQRYMYSEGGKALFADTATLGAFYPFGAGEILKSGGLFLGMNVSSGAPVVYNPLARHNLNVSIFGASGSGKSFTTKIFIKRMLDKHPDTPTYVIDPEGEYAPLVAWLGGEVVRVAGHGGLGLDPLALFEKGEAADMVCDMAGLEERKDVSRIRDAVMRSSSLKELYGSLPRDLKEKLSSIMGGPESFIFRGEALLFSPVMSFDLKGIESKTVKQLVSLLVMGKIWQIVSKPDAFGLSRATPRVVVVDEAWLFMEMPSAATFLEKVARGRSDGEIHAFFRHMDDYDYEKTQYQIEHARKMGYRYSDSAVEEEYRRLVGC
ncbi:MAG: DUF87 domain-containing protein [Candidatus Methanomethylicaceae archaeon]